MLDSRLTLNPEDIRRLQKEDPAKLKRALFKGMNAAMRTAEARAASMLSGSVLSVKSGLLKQGLQSEVRQLDFWTIGNLRIDKDAYYGRIWETGITGPVKVEAYERTIRKVFGRTVSPVTASVSGFQRQIKEKARPFRTPAIEAAEPVFVNSFKQAIDEEFGR